MLTSKAVKMNDAQTTPKRVIVNITVAIDNNVPSISRNPNNVNIKVIAAKVKKSSNGNMASPDRIAINSVAIGCSSANFNKGLVADLMSSSFNF